MKNRWLVALALTSLVGCTAAPLPADVKATQHARGMHHAAPAVGLSLSGSLLVDGVLNGEMTPGQRGEWVINFKDGRTGLPITRYDLYHEKPMHLIVVHRDLSTFAHLHPALDSSGRFRLIVNASSDDPDNRDATQAVSRPGTYFLFGELVPSGQSKRVVRLSVQATGPERREPQTADAVMPSGEMVKYLKTDGRVGSAGDAYRVSLLKQIAEHHPGMSMVTFTFKVQERNTQGRYVDVTNLETWLGMPGHAVLIGTAGDHIDDRVFRHLHASHGDGLEHGTGSQGRGPDLTFMAMGDDVPPAGMYRLWGQFKHRGRVLTVPVTLRL